MAPLAAYVQRLRGSCGRGHHVPDFDPLDGGIRAECLFLLEAPGARAVESGFVSRNNPDETAKNFFVLSEEAGLPREKTVSWNIVPWYVGTGERIRPVTRADLAAALPHLQELLALLPHLRVIVLVGRHAQTAVLRLTDIRGRYRVLECPHPSPRSFNARPALRSEILHCLHAVAGELAVYRSA